MASLAASRKRFQVDARLLPIRDVVNVQGRQEFDKGQKKRYAAIASVLSKVPDEDYDRLCRVACGFAWFIPSTSILGKKMLCPCFGLDATRANIRVIYLSPDLERRGQSLVEGVVAHELAHFLLNHEGPNKNQHEEEAIACIRRWGFDLESTRQLIGHILNQAARAN